MILAENATQIKQASQVLEYFGENGSITSQQAWEMFGITRLSSVIYRLRKLYDIETVPTNGVNRDGLSCRFATYVFKGVKK